MIDRSVYVYIYMATDQNFAYNNALQNHLPPAFRAKKSQKKAQKMAPFLDFFEPLILFCSFVMTTYHPYLCKFRLFCLKMLFSPGFNAFLGKVLKTGDLLNC